MNRCLFPLVLLCVSTAAQSAACLIESNDDALPLRMCQQNINIPPQLFNDSFCQPQIAERSFNVSFLEQCPEGAYGICGDARSEGVGYRQSIHYYSEPGDEPVLKAYCEKFSQGRWRRPLTRIQSDGGDDN